MRVNRLVRVLAVLLLLAVSAASVRSIAAQEYTIGPGDVLKITVWGHDDLSKEYPVTLDGRVPFPLIGSVAAVGLTTTQFAKRLHDLLEKDYLVNPQVIVAVKEYLSHKVQVLGDAEKPGLVYLTGPTTLLEVLSKAGGLSKTAGKDVLIVRPIATGGNTILRIDLRKVHAGDTKDNIFVENGDMMFVPKASAIFVLGEVTRAGTFPLDKETSVLEAVTLAGGFSNAAAPGGVKILRRTASGKQETISLDLAGAVPKDKDYRLEDGDTVLVPKGNTFFVFGEVKKPGAYQLDKDTNVLEGITIAGGFTDKAAPGRTRVIRTTIKGQQTLNIDMNDVIRRGQRDKAIRIIENDVIVVPESFF
ncbi:MAG TPA: SLBB domain-containing protein [Methylomirabilota bacterium]|jgi:polysaccharide export outer membrane protein|nr:SLBB domain-containing protein [Methylomirabilota bacterium]